MHTSDFQFQPDISKALTLPARYYFDPGVLADEYERIFGRTWQLGGGGHQLERPGDYCATTIGAEPVLIIRGSDGVLRAMSNVCRHRAGPVARGAGNRKVMQCGYHGWTYALDGRLLKTPEFDGVLGFDRDRVCLPRFRVEAWGQLVFVALSSSVPPLETVIGEIIDEFRGRDFSRYHSTARKEWIVDCNWKVYVDNYLEGYHIPIVHPALFRELDYPNYRTETRQFHSIQHSPIKSPKRLRSSQDAATNEARFFWIYPNLMLNVYPDNFSTNLILPLGPEKTITIFEWYFAPGAAAPTVDATVEFSDEIQIEDIEICEAVQRGLRSSTYQSGRYSVSRENGVHHFHGLYTNAMSGPVDGPYSEIRESGTGIHDRNGTGS